MYVDLPQWVISIPPLSHAQQLPPGPTVQSYQGVERGESCVPMSMGNGLVHQAYTPLAKSSLTFHCCTHCKTVCKQFLPRGTWHDEHNIFVGICSSSTPLMVAVVLFIRETSVLRSSIGVWASTSAIGRWSRPLVAFSTVHQRPAKHGKTGRYGQFGLFRQESLWYSCVGCSCLVTFYQKPSTFKQSLKSKGNNFCSKNLWLAPMYTISANRT